MASKAAQLIVEFTRAGLSGSVGVGEHPCVVFPSYFTEEVQREELFDVQDRALAQIPGYLDEVKIQPIIRREWVIEDEVVEGYLKEFFKSTFDGIKNNFLEAGTEFYEMKVSRLDRALIDDATRIWAFFSRKKIDYFGRFSSEQGDFFHKLKSQNPLSAMHYSYKMSNLGFDRLVLYGMDREALKSSVKIIPKDRKRVQEVRDTFIHRYEEELCFWVNRFLFLRTTYDVLHHLMDGHEVFQYKERTGATSPYSTKHPWLWYKIEQKDQNALYAKLLQAFYRDSCAFRKPGFLTRGSEWFINKVGSLYADEIGAPSPGSYPECLETAQKKIRSIDASLDAYFEIPAFETSRVFDFFEAIRMDFKSLAKQIALNGRLAQNRDLNWDDELIRLKDYDSLLKELFRAQDEFYKLKERIARKLTDPANVPLREIYFKADKGEYEVQATRNRLKMSYQKTIQGEVNGKNKGIWEKWTESLKDQAIRFLVTNRAFEKSPLYEEYAPTVWEMIGNFGNSLREIRRHLGLDVLDSGINFEAVTSEPIMSEEEGLESSQVQPARLIEAGTETPKNDILDDYVTNVEKLKKRVVHKSKPTVLRPSMLDLASTDEIDQMALISQARFYTAEGYETFIGRDHFTTLKTIDDALAFCRKNITDNQPGWNWSREEGDLLLYRRLISRLDELSKMLTPVLASAIALPTPQISPSHADSSPDKIRLDEIRGVLLQSFLKKFYGDYHEYHMNSVPSFAPLTDSLRESASHAKQWAGTKFFLWIKSGERKGIRVIKSLGTIVRNPFPHFRDAKFIQRVEEELGLVSIFPRSSISAKQIVEDNDEWLLLSDVSTKSKAAESSKSVQTQEVKEVKSAPPSLGTPPAGEDASMLRRRMPSSEAESEPKRAASLPQSGLSSPQDIVKFDNVEEYKVFVEKPTFNDLGIIRAAIEVCNQNCAKQQQLGWNWEHEKRDLTLFYWFLNHIDVLSESLLPPLSVSVSSSSDQSSTPKSSSTLDKARLDELQVIFYESFLKRFYTDYSAHLRASSSWMGMRSLNEMYLGWKSGARKTERMYKSSGTAYQNSAPEFRDIAFLCEVSKELSLTILIPSSLKTYEDIKHGRISMEVKDHWREQEKKKKEEKAKGDEKAADRAKKE